MNYPRKALHDLLALAALIAPKELTWLSGYHYRATTDGLGRARGEWGFIHAEHSHIQAAVAYNPNIHNVLL